MNIFSVIWDLDPIPFPIAYLAKSLIPKTFPKGPVVMPWIPLQPHFWESVWGEDLSRKNQQTTYFWQRQCGELNTGSWPLTHSSTPQAWQHFDKLRLSESSIEMIQNTLCGHIKMNKSIYNSTVHFRLRLPIVNLNHEKSAKADQKTLHIWNWHDICKRRQRQKSLKLRPLLRPHIWVKFDF